MTRRNFLGSLIASIAIATCPDVVRKSVVDFADVFPRIKVVNFETIARELVSVQPMSPPLGTIFHMSFSHES